MRHKRLTSDSTRANLVPRVLRTLGTRLHEGLPYRERRNAAGLYKPISRTNLTKVRWWENYRYLFRYSSFPKSFQMCFSINYYGAIPWVKDQSADTIVFKTLQKKNARQPCDCVEILNLLNTDPQKILKASLWPSEIFDLFLIPIRKWRLRTVTLRYFDLFLSENFVNRRGQMWF